MEHMNPNEPTGQSPDPASIVQPAHYAFERINTERRKISDQYTPLERAEDRFYASVSSTMHAIRHSNARSLENITVRLDIVDIPVPRQYDSINQSSNGPEQTTTFGIATAVTEPVPCILAVVPVSSCEDDPQTPREIAAALLDASIHASIGRVLTSSRFSSPKTILEFELRNLEYIIPDRSSRPPQKRTPQLPTYVVRNPSIERGVDVVINGTPETTTDVALIPSEEDSTECDRVPLLTNVPVNNPKDVQEEYFKPLESRWEATFGLFRDLFVDRTFTQDVSVEYDAWSVAVDVNAFYLAQILSCEDLGQEEFEVIPITAIHRERRRRSLNRSTRTGLVAE